MSETIARTMNVAAPAAPAVIPGYELHEKIGAGGYGEVWRALAPGGVQKAVKIVYGGVDESRGVAELKSLERIKDARHPFLLVLERFDVVDGRLVIVTELAEGSLKDRFDEYRAQGKPGIPRTELLEYLRDSADALDFMFEKHGLAHLDIKPENVLLVGGRAKVADFGLTKDISRESMSMMSGLTPQFAAPEIFEGRAARQSDQYSLAIVYQILLTGQPPFSGRTAAQLTAQHLHSTPSLSSLPPSDRAAISRALAKKATQRFDSCRAFVEELLEKPNRRRAAEPKVDRRPGRRRDTVTAEDVPAQITLRFGQASPPAAQDRFLEPLPRTPTAAQPALVVGIGGVGRRILHRLNGSPTVRRILLDVDPAAISELRRSTEPGATAIEPVSIPLRSSSEYRRESSKWLEWIDRRWLYNVPRSLQTEGIRPLGRLACLSNESTITEALQRHLDELPDDRPAVVYLVGASSGGTASGAVVDLAHLARNVAGERAIECRALLVHAKKQNSVNGDLADASTLSLLSELRHLDAERRRDVDDDGRARLVFDDVHLVDAGDTGDEEDVEFALHTAAVYLERSLSLATEATDRSAGETPTLATIGYARVPGAEESAIVDLADRAARDLLLRWTNPLPAERSTELPGLASGFLAKLSFDVDAILADVERLAGPTATRLEAVVRTIAGQRGTTDAAPVLAGLLDECLATAEEAADEAHPAHV